MKAAKIPGAPSAPAKHVPPHTKQRILETAIELFSRNGFPAVSVREITKHVGIKESALYNHFKSKDEILETIYAVFRSELTERGLPPAEQLEELLEREEPEEFLMRGMMHFMASADHPQAAKIWRILHMEQFRDPRARAIMLEDVYQGTLLVLETAFRILQRQGAMMQEDPRLLAFEYQYPLFTIMTEYLLWRIDGRDTEELENRVKAHIGYFIRGVYRGAQ